MQHFLPREAEKSLRLPYITLWVYSALTCMMAHYSTSDLSGSSHLLSFVVWLWRICIIRQVFLGECAPLKSSLLKVNIVLNDTRIRSLTHPILVFVAKACIHLRKKHFKNPTTNLYFKQTIFLFPHREKQYGWLGCVSEDA